MPFTVDLIRDERQICEAVVRQWNRLAQNPFQRWEWLGNWWWAHRSDYSLAILRVCHDGETVAFAPWCIRSHKRTGRTLQFLGSGKASTDHLSILVRSESIEPACQAIASWLATEASKSSQSTALRWDTLELIGVDRNDRAIEVLSDRFDASGFAVDRVEGTPSCSIELPTTWEEYVGWRSKRGRREIRQSIGHIDSGLLSVRLANDPETFEYLWPKFVTLHQARRHSMGTNGCFDYPGFEPFLKNAGFDFLRSKQLELRFAMLQDKPISAVFGLTDSNRFYLYQSGMDLSERRLRPGLSLLFHAIRESIEQGRQSFDLMRGDEPYKLRLRGKRQLTVDTRIFSSKSTARLRGKIYRAGVTVKNLIRTGIGNSSTTG